MLEVYHQLIMLVLYTHYTHGKLNKMTWRIWDERFAVVLTGMIRSWYY